MLSIKKSKITATNAIRRFQSFGGVEEPKKKTEAKDSNVHRKLMSTIIARSL